MGYTSWIQNLLNVLTTLLIKNSEHWSGQHRFKKTSKYVTTFLSLLQLRIKNEQHSNYHDIFFFFKSREN